LKKTILIVDDEKLIRNLLEEFCKQSGYESILCENAEQAVNRITDADLVITDFQMPGMSGADLAKVVKKEKPGLPIIIFTGTPGEVPKDHSANVLISKPFELKGLREITENLLSRAV